MTADHPTEAVSFATPAQALDALEALLRGVAAGGPAPHRFGGFVASVPITDSTTGDF